MKQQMSFESTGLPKSDAIEKAYTYALELHVGRFAEELDIANKSIDDQMKKSLEMAIKSGQYTADQIEDLTKQQKKSVNIFKKQVEQQILVTRDTDFIARVVKPACVLSKNNAKNESTISAILLIETIRSPKDYEMIKKDFGSDVSNIIADILDFEAYPREYDKKIETLSDNSKLANLALMVGKLKSVLELGKKLPSGDKLILVSGEEGARNKIKFASDVRGLDSNLDDIFIKTFNEVSNYVDIGMKIELDSETNTLKAISFKAPTRGKSGPKIGGGFSGNDTPPSGDPNKGGPKIGGGF